MHTRNGREGGEDENEDVGCVWGQCEHHWERGTLLTECSLKVLTGPSWGELFYFQI